MKQILTLMTVLSLFSCVEDPDPNPVGDNIIIPISGEMRCGLDGADVSRFRKARDYNLTPGATVDLPDNVYAGKEISFEVKEGVIVGLIECENNF